MPDLVIGIDLLGQCFELLLVRLSNFSGGRIFFSFLFLLEIRCTFCAFQQVLYNICVAFKLKLQCRWNSIQMPPVFLSYLILLVALIVSPFVRLQCAHTPLFYMFFDHWGNFYQLLTKRFLTIFWSLIFYISFPRLGYFS